jgi:hypothetical protein
MGWRGQDRPELLGCLFGCLAIIVRLGLIRGMTSPAAFVALTEDWKAIRAEAVTHSTARPRLAFGRLALAATLDLHTETSFCANHVPAILPADRRKLTAQL